MLRQYRLLLFATLYRSINTFNNEFNELELKIIKNKLLMHVMTGVWMKIWKNLFNFTFESLTRGGDS